MKRPKITCGAIIKKNNKILLVKRNRQPYKNYWCLPGGHIEWQENAEKAIIREVKEETGLSFYPRFWRYFDEIIPSLKWHAIVLFFTGKFKGKTKANSREVKETKWFSQKEIKNISLAFYHREILKIYFKEDVQKKEI